jgi:PAS domain S-box-containing protein
MRNLTSAPRGTTMPKGIIDTEQGFAENQAVLVELQMQNRELRTARDQAELALRRFTDLYDSAPIGYLTLRRDGSIRDINVAGARLLGSPRSRLRNQPFAAFVDADDRDRLARFAEKVFASDTKRHCELTLTPSGQRPPVSAHVEATRDAQGQECRLAITDITERKQAERLIRQSDQRFRTIAAATSEGLAITANGMFVDINERLANMLGYIRSDLIGTPMADIVAPEDRERVMANIASGREGFTEHAIVRVDGARLIVESHSQSIVENRVPLRLTALRDITERRRTEDELRAAKVEAERANAAKSRFLAAASHDLRQPLSALSLYVGTLEERLPQADKELARNMKQCVTGLSELLSDLLDLSKLEAGIVVPKVCDFSLDSVLGKVISSLEPKAKRKRLALRYRYGGKFGRTDPVLFRRIITNLVSNAIRYTERGGVLIGCRHKDGRSWVEVWDTGIGIPDDKTSEIFEEFKQLGNNERNREKGTGIGLTIVAKEAALLGLKVRVRSVVGRGSMFAVELPPGDPVQPVQPQAGMLRPLRIAVVEDDVNVAAALSYALSSLGHTAIVSPSGEETLQKLEGLAPDIVVSDYRLAGSETGYDVVASMRAAFGQNLPAMIITGDTDPALMRQMAKKAVAVQHKPLNLETFCATLTELTERRAAANR